MAHYYNVVTSGNVPIMVEDVQQICDGQSIQLVVEDINNCVNGTPQFVTYAAAPQHHDTGLFSQIGNQLATVPIEQRQNVYVITNDLPVQQNTLKSELIHESTANDNLYNIVDERGSKVSVNNIHEVQQQQQQPQPQPQPQQHQIQQQAQQIQWVMPENNINYESPMKTTPAKVQGAVRTPQQRTGPSLTLQGPASQPYSGPGPSDKKPIKLYKNKARGAVTGGGPPRQSQSSTETIQLKKPTQTAQKISPKSPQGRQASPALPSTAPIINNSSSAAYRGKTFGTPVQSAKAPDIPRQVPGLKLNVPGMPALHFPGMQSLSERIKQAGMRKLGMSSPPALATPRPPLHPPPLPINRKIVPIVGQQRPKSQQTQEVPQNVRQMIESIQKQTSMSCQQKYQRDRTEDNDERMEVDNNASEGGYDNDASTANQENQSEDGTSASIAYLQKVIENPSTTIVQNQVDGNTVKMLVALHSGEQRLITFDIPNEPCTVQDLLEQASITFEGDTCVSLVYDRMLGINYIVEISPPFNFPDGAEEGEGYVFLNNKNPAPDSSTPNLGASDENSNSSITQNEEPKYIDGKVAVCPNCGIGSLDFNRCSRCKKRLPENVKSIATSDIQAKKEAMISIDSFYKKTHEHNASSKLEAAMGKKRTSKVGRKPAAKTRPIKEPECLTLSSDEEEDGKPRKSKSHLSNSSSLAGVSSTSNDEQDAIHEKEPIITNSSSHNTIERNEDSEGGIKGGGRENQGLDDLSSDQLQTTLICRTVRIGSYKYIPRDGIVISQNGLRLAVPLLEDDNSFVNIDILVKDIVKVLIHFGKAMPVLFFYTSTSMGALIREVLGMQDPLGPYYDPAGKDHTHKRITLLPDRMEDDSRLILKNVFTPGNLLEELDSKEANDILIRASPKDILQAQSIANFGRRQSQSALNNNGNGGGCQIMTVYPPPPAKGGIAINTEDYICLGEDQFLNDAIIDFYLRYLTMELLSDVDQHRTHVFSSFFYKRLTSPHAQVGDSTAGSLTAAARRHARVQKWTKNVNIFEKDFIIIPINEHAHWFLAIICYPALVGKVPITHTAVKDNSIQKTVQKSKKLKEVKLQAVTIGNTTITPLATTITIDQMDEGSERDEAEGDDEEMEVESDEDDEADSSEPLSSPDFNPKSPECPEKIQKLPCILIFDSLAGATRNRVVATLRDYLSCEHVAKVGTEKTFSKDTIKGMCPKVPQQSNFTDCGLYLLQYVESFFKDPIQNYTFPIKTLKNWFEEIVVTRKREEIARLLVRLMNATKGDKTISIPIVQFPTMNGILRPKPEGTTEPKTPKVEGEAKKTKLATATQQTPSAADDKTRVVALSTSSVVTTAETASESSELVTRTTTIFQILGSSASQTNPSSSDSGSPDTIFDAKPRTSSGTLSYLRNKRIPRLMSREAESQDNQAIAMKKHKGENNLVTRTNTGTTSSIVTVAKAVTTSNYDSCK